MTTRKTDDNKRPETQDPTPSSKATTGESAPLRQIPTLFENLYEIVVAAATRARQINAGSPSPIQTEDTRPLNVALRELAAGRTQYELSDGEPKE